MNFSKPIYGELNTVPHWYALTTRCRHEKKVNERLQQKGINSYLPLYSTYRTWSDRTKRISEPLFSCYLFVKIALKERLPVLQTAGAIRLVSFEHIPAPIPEWQIDSIRQLLDMGALVEKVDHWTVGQRVEVIDGPLIGVHGTLQQTRGNTKLVVAVDALSQAVAVEIDASLVKPLPETV